METVRHEEQQTIWDREHQVPNVLPQVHSTEASSSVVKFMDWLVNEGNQISELKGLEICCGKGRNVIGLAKEGATMIGLDFSPSAIKEAQRRAAEAEVNTRAGFLVSDVTEPFPIKSG